MLRYALILLALWFPPVSARAETILFNQPGPDNASLLEQLAALGVEAFGETAGIVPDTDYFDVKGEMVRIRNTTDNLGSVAGLRITTTVSAGTVVTITYSMRRLMASSATEFEDLFEITGTLNGVEHVFESYSSHEPYPLFWLTSSYTIPDGTPPASAFVIEATMTRVSGVTLSTRYTSGMLRSVEITAVPLPSALLLFGGALFSLIGARRHRV